LQKKLQAYPLFRVTSAYGAEVAKTITQNFNILVDGPEVAKIAEPSVLKFLFVIAELKHSS